MPRLPIPGNDNGQWGNLLNEFLQVSHNTDGTPANVVTSIVGLKAASPADAAKFDTVYVKGYYAAGDGGGGVFCWDAASTATDNGGTVIVLNAGGTGRWKRATGGAINVKWFGAKADGTDETTVIQKAVDHAGGQPVFFPAGTYAVNNLTLPANTTVFSEGGTTLKGFSGAGNVLSIGAGCMVRNLTIDGNKANKTGGMGIQAAWADGCVIEACTIRDCFGQGIQVQNTNGFLIAKNDVSHCGGSPSPALFQGIIVVFSTQGRIVDNHVTHCQHGIQYWGSLAERVSDLVIQGNYVGNVDGGGIWGAYGNRISIVNNNVSTCLDVGIDFEITIHSTATGNTVRNCTNGGLTCFENCSHIVFSGNAVEQEAGYGPGVWMTGKEAEVNTYILITGNDIKTATSSGIRSEDDRLVDSQIVGNTVLALTGWGIDVHTGDRVNILSNMIQCGSPNGICFQGISHSLIANNTVEHLGTDSSNPGEGGGIRIYWVSTARPCQYNTIKDNVVRGFVTGINDDCWGNIASYNYFEGNRTNTIHRKAGTWYGRASGNVSIDNPNTDLTVVPY